MFTFFYAWFLNKLLIGGMDYVVTRYDPCSVKIIYSRIWYLHNLLGSIQFNHLIAYTYGMDHNLNRIWFVLDKIAYAKNLFVRLLINYEFNYLKKKINIKIYVCDHLKIWKYLFIIYILQIHLWFKLVSFNLNIINF